MLLLLLHSLCVVGASTGDGGVTLLGRLRVRAARHRNAGEATISPALTRTAGPKG
jgi:hypothetical protein